MVALGVDGSLRTPSAVLLDQTGAVIVCQAALEQAPWPRTTSSAPERALDQHAVLPAASAPTPPS
jgi:hypothetical protein